MERVESAWSEFETTTYFWDWITLFSGVLLVISGLALLIWILGLPGRIAIRRNHPDAEAVYAMAWTGFLAIVPWIQALIWAFKPTDKVDIRYLPQQERLAELEELQRLSRYAYGRDLPPEQKAELDRLATARERDPGGASPRPGADPGQADADPFRAKD